MNDALLAPPKLTVRKYAWMAGCVSVAAIVAGGILAVLGLMRYADLGKRTVMVAAFAGATLWGYGRLLRIRARIRPERLPMIHALAGMMGLVAFYGTFGLMLRHTPFEGGMPSFFWIFPIIFGITLAAGGVARRVGESLHCPKCDYEFAFDDKEDAPIRCPECGSGWLGLLKKGRRVKSPRLIAAGIIIAITGMIVGQPILYMGTLAPHLPTPVLYASLYAAPRGMFEPWNELATRQLDPQWVRRMAERVLEIRSRNQHDNTSARWFEAMAAAGKIPKDLEERFYREGFRAHLRTPRRVKAGEPFPVELVVTHAAPSFGVHMALMFAGYDPGDGSSAVGRRDKTQWSFELRPGVLQGRRSVLAETLKVDRPAEVRVRATYWLVYQPSFTDNLVWQADGTPVRPSTATWFERIDVEQALLVE